jgi:phenylpropionate dioxygenase-like ring-hydroxylating dioxygenase large terminal subunit
VPAPASFQAVANDDLAFLGTEPVPAAPYYEPAHYELERDAIFRRTWLHAGRVSEIAQPNSFIVRRIAAARASVLVTRASDGAIRAFHNVCSHRGNELVWEEAGLARSFSCRYHMWNYSNDGSLRSVPDEQRFFSLDKSACGLRPVSVDTCAGFIFVNVDTEPDESLQDFLGPIAEELEHLGFARFTDFEQYSCEVGANWKTVFHNFQETYHVRWVHRPSSGGRATSRENPFGYPSRYRFCGPHSGGTHWIPSHPLLTDVQTKAMTAGGLPEDAPCRGSWEFFYLFPNLYVEALAGTNTFTMQFWPLGPDRTRMVVRVYRYGTDRTASMRFSREYAASSLMDVHVEDVELVEANHRGLSSGAVDRIHFQAQEAICRHFHRTVSDMVRTQQGSRAHTAALNAR